MRHDFPIPPCKPAPLPLFPQLKSIFRGVTEGGPNRPPFFVLDRPEPNHTGLEARLTAIVSPTLEGMGYELVRVTVLGRDRPTVQVMADRADGSQITVSDCEAISHARS